VPELRLQPMREEELPAFVAASEAGYAEQLERFAYLAPDRASAKSRADHDSLFSASRPADGVLVLVVEDAETGAALGRIVYAERPPGSGTAWLYDIELEERARGRGFARLELNVFGGNEVARSLYQNSGYRELAVMMGKALDDDRTSPSGT
jgi:RimJ/RimL family protein N-acetyltransferase